MKSLFNGQQMMSNIAQMARGNFDTVVFVLGRMAGKSTLASNLIQCEILRLMSIDDQAPGRIMYLTQTMDMTRRFSIEMRKDIDWLDKECNQRFIHIEGERKISISFDSFDSIPLMSKASLIIIDELSDDLNSIDRTLDLCDTEDHLRIVFRTTSHKGDVRPGVLIIQAMNYDLNLTIK